MSKLTNPGLAYSGSEEPGTVVPWRQQFTSARGRTSFIWRQYPPPGRGSCSAWFHTEVLRLAHVTGDLGQTAPAHIGLLGFEGARDGAASPGCGTHGTTKLTDCSAILRCALDKRGTGEI